jgi:phage shock protein A
MTTMGRVRRLFRAKANSTLDRIEDPQRVLDASYERQIVLLQDVRRGLAEVATARKRLELQRDEMEGRYDRLAVNAREAVQQGRDDLARLALMRRAALKEHVAMIAEQHTALAAQEAQLIANQERIAARIEAFWIEKETLKATYRASEAQARLNEVVAGISGEMSHAGQTVQRARTQVKHMQARAQAIDELLATGAMAGVLGADTDSDRHLHESLRAVAADAELAELKREVLPASTGTRVAQLTPESRKASGGGGL